MLISMKRSPVLLLCSLSLLWSAVTLHAETPDCPAKKWSIGEVDPLSGLTPTEYRALVSRASRRWAEVTGIEWFVYQTGAAFKVSVRADETQTELLGREFDRESLEADVEAWQQKNRDFARQVSVSNRKAVEIERDVIAHNQRWAVLKQRIEGATHTTLAEEIEALKREGEALRLRMEAFESVRGVFDDRRDSLESDREELQTRLDEFNAHSDSRPLVLGTHLGAARESREIEILAFRNLNDLESILVHEFGHALGLDHNPDPASIMHATHHMGSGLYDQVGILQSDLDRLNQICRYR